MTQNIFRRSNIGMTTRTAKAGDIHNLESWVKRWPKYDNLEFDSISREPSIYTDVKRGDPGRTKITNENLRWKREGDVMTILSDPKSFSPEMVETATAAYRKYHSDMENIKITNIDVLRQREATLLDAWEVYGHSPSPSSLQDVLKAQKDFTEIEKLLMGQTHQGRKTIFRGENLDFKAMYKNVAKKEEIAYIGIYDPALPWNKRIMSQPK